MIDLRINQTKKILKYFLGFILIAFLSFLVINNFDLLLNFNTPKIEKPLFFTSENQELLSSSPKASFKEKLEVWNNPVVFRSEGREKLTKSKASFFAEVLGFASNPTSETDSMLVWLENGKSLRVNLDLQTLDYAQDSETQALKSLSSINERRAVDEIENLFEKLGLLETLFNFNQSSTIYSDELTNFTDGHEHTAEIEKIDPTQADFLNLFYDLKAKNREIYSLFPLANKIEAIITRGNKLTRLKAPILLTRWEEYLEYPTLSANGIIKDLEGGSATLVSYTKKTNQFSPKVDPIVEIEILKLEQVYLLGKNSYEYLIPSYIITANCTTDQREKVDCIFYLPAISSYFFK